MDGTTEKIAVCRIHILIPRSNAILDSYEHLADILTLNTTLKSLTFKPVTQNEKNFLATFADGLKSNRSLTQLTIGFKENNYSVLCEGLEQNDTLTSLDLDGPVPLPGEVAKIANILKFNTTISSLRGVGVNDWCGIFSALKANSSLRTLHLANTGHEKTDDFFEELEKTLQVNRSLTSLSVVNKATTKMFEIPPKCAQMLRRNYLVYQGDVNSVYYLITMIVLRPEVFTSILPLEIWLLILKKIRIGGCKINFSELLVKSLDK